MYSIVVWDFHSKFMFSSNVNGNIYLNAELLWLVIDDSYIHFEGKELIKWYLVRFLNYLSLN